MVSSENNNIIGKMFKNDSVANPFGGANISQESFIMTNKGKRLNGYDSTILNNSNIDNESDMDLSIDYRIQEKESAIKNLDIKIKMADNYGTQSESLGLKAKRQRLMEELHNLQVQKSHGGNAIINDSFESKSKSTFKKVRNFVSRNILAKVSKKVNSVVALSDSLEQLSIISKNVDELVDMNIPYGERVQSYEKLTQYLSKANAIHSSISKSLRK